MNRRQLLRTFVVAAGLTVATRRRDVLAYRPLSDGGDGKCKSKKRCKQRRR
jgi:hypothetical protein